MPVAFAPHRFPFFRRRYAADPDPAASPLPPVKVALVTTSPERHSGIADYTRHLLPYLAQHVEVELFVEPGAITEGVQVAGRPIATVDRLDPSRFDRILFQLGNEQNHAFMAPMIRRLGGVVMQHDWVLFDLALAAYPALVRGGPKGALLAAREGGTGQLRTYLANWTDRRLGRRRPIALPQAPFPPGELLTGWHAADENGRWCADNALLRLPADGVRGVTVVASAAPGARVELVHLREDGSSIGELARTTCTKQQPWAELSAELEPADRPVLALRVAPVRVTREQRQHGDARRLAAHVERVAWRGSDGERELDLAQDCARPIEAVSLSRDRFRLSLNRSIVRHADAFVVHSRYVGDRIRRLRGADAPIGLVLHGAERRWHDEPQRDVRLALGLPEAWCDGFLLASFGGVQAHKRVDRVLAGLALARERNRDIHLVMVGNVCSEGFDAHAEARRLGLDDAVHFAGFAPEEDVWRWLHAADAAINLRGPTSGGSSGGIFQSFAFGRPVIASDAAEQAELPGSCTLRVPLGAGEIEAIAAHLVELAAHPERLAELQAATRRFVDDECHWSHCAKGYVEALRSAPAHGGARRVEPEAPGYSITEPST